MAGQSCLNKENMMKELDNKDLENVSGGWRR
ncbi:bacteriocin [Salinimonas marina]|uniref:Bacteriocin n=1 Tax=Salinimonas marina TaxID=2785918 RepID=A0A7S9HCN9_9ALTE|nr:bacteriocin [Salinimonas marina]